MPYNEHLVCKAILFDLDETLLDRTNSLRSFLSDQYLRFSKKLGRVDFETWRDEFIFLDARGHTHKSILYPALISKYGGVVDAGELLADYRERCSHHARPFAGVGTTLRTLKRHGFRLGIVSNGEGDFQMRHVKALALNEVMDVILISETEGLRKPDTAIFHRAADRLNAVPSECLFVGDNPTADVLGAHATGMQTVWLRNGSSWPEGLPAPPGKTIDHLPDLLTLLGLDV